MTTKLSDPADVVRSLYTALAAGDVPGVLAHLDEGITVDEPAALPYGGVHHGVDDFVQNCLGAMTAHADIELTDFDVFSGGGGRVVGLLNGALIARTSGERFPLRMLEVHDISGERSTRIEVFIKNPDELARFLERHAS